MIPPKPIYSYLAAAVLAVVTIFTFYTFQNFGPQSVIRRFHVDAAQFDQLGIKTVATKGMEAPSTYNLVTLVRLLFRRDASYEIVDLKRLPQMPNREPEVIATVEYRLSDGSAQIIWWHVLQRTNSWLIDSDATWREFVSRSLQRGNGLAFN